MRRGSLPGKAFSDTVFSREGEPALLIEEYSVSPGRKIRIEFEEANSAWRQGIFLATHGLPKVSGSHSPSFVLWKETAPRIVDVEIVKSTGTMIFYNVWDSERGLGPFESQSNTSGMIREDLPVSGYRYRCNDIGRDPKLKS